MAIVNVQGEKKGEILLYALSTCGWCKKTKAYLNELGVEYSYIDVDLLTGTERDTIMDEVRKWNPSCSFPTLVFKNKTCVVGYKKDDIKEAIG